MFSYLYATCVAAVLFNVGTSTPIPQSTPIYECPQGYQWCNLECKQITCPSTHYLQNCVCYLRAPVVHPCPPAITSCPTTVVPIPVPQPCPTPSCPTATNCQSPCPTACPSPCQSPPCPIPTSPPCPTPGPTPSPPTQPPPPPPTPSPTRPPRPEPIIKCPEGTILINGYCHLIYCGHGIYRKGKCIQTECPDGTIWTGSRCEVPTPHNHTTVYMTNVITTNVNQTDVNREINYTNNMAIYITESPIIIKAPPTPAPSPAPSPSSETNPTTTRSPSTNCCVVVTPRKCVSEGDRYSCRSRKYRQCGSICTHGYIYLKPPTEVLPPPPPPPPCAENNCGYDHEPFYPDCSSCNTAINDNCSLYCERTICQTRRCHSVDLRAYCGNYPGSIGCRPVDGCTQDWCSGF